MCICVWVSGCWFDWVNEMIGVVIRVVSVIVLISDFMMCYF